MPKGIDFHIEHYKLKTGLSYVDSFLEYCEEHNLDPEEIVIDLSKPLIEKIKTEFVNRRMVKNQDPNAGIGDEFF